MEQYAAQLVSAVILGFLVWIAREVHAHGRELVSIRMRLFGDEQEQNGGMAGELRRLEGRVAKLEGGT